MAEHSSVATIRTLLEYNGRVFPKRGQWSPRVGRATDVYRSSVCLISLFSLLSPRLISLFSIVFVTVSIPLVIYFSPPCLFFTRCLLILSAFTSISFIFGSSSSPKTVFGLHPTFFLFFLLLHLGAPLLPPSTPSFAWPRFSSRLQSSVTNPHDSPHSRGQVDYACSLKCHLLSLLLGIDLCHPSKFLKKKNDEMTNIFWTIIF